MQHAISRRHFVGTAVVAGALLLTGHSSHAQGTNVTSASKGGIGLPQQEFESVYGQGTTSGDLVVYPNPYLDGSQLSVMYEGGVATFIDMSVPDASNVDPSNGPDLLQNVLPGDATSLASWIFPDVGADVPVWAFNEFDARSMHMAGSGATRMQTCTATVGVDRLVRATVSLAIPEGADQFAPAQGSLGVGANGEQWQEIHGFGHPGDAAMGTYSASYSISPWDEVIVISHRTEGEDTEVTTINAINAITNTGVSVSDAMAFGEHPAPERSVAGSV